MKTIDTTVLAGYNAGIEWDRLRTGMGLIEFERTKELLTEYLPKPPAVIYDIGGGYGEYAWWLASLGYEVHLFDIAETNIAISKDLQQSTPAPPLLLQKSPTPEKYHAPRGAQTPSSLWVPSIPSRNTRNASLPSRNAAAS